MLQAILGYSEMAMAQIPNDQPVHADIEAVQNAARRAADLGVRVHTVAFGTADGVIPGLEGYSFYARVDEETLQAVAKTTGGEFYRASNAEDLGHIYDKLSSQIALETRLTEVSVLFAALALALVLSALGLSLRWFRQAR